MNKTHESGDWVEIFDMTMKHFPSEETADFSVTVLDKMLSNSRQIFVVKLTFSMEMFLMNHDISVVKKWMIYNFQLEWLISLKS